MKVGSRMQDAIWGAGIFPGILKTNLDRMISSHGSMHFGTNAVNRALKADLLRLGTCEEAFCQAPNKAHCHIWAVK